MDALVQLKNVTKRYEAAPVAAIDDVSLRIDVGALVPASWAANSRTATALRAE